MARVKIADILDQLNVQMRGALDEAVARTLPGVDRVANFPKVGNPVPTPRWMLNEGVIGEAGTWTRTAWPI